MSKQIEDPALNHQFKGTKLISMYSGGMYGGTYDRGARVRTIEVLAPGARDVRTVADERVTSEYQH